MQLSAIFFFPATFLCGVVFTFSLQSKIEKVALQRFLSLLDALGSEWHR
jgi:hypothetical protein